jgi:hypothetical protein
VKEQGFASPTSSPSSGQLMMMLMMSQLQASWHLVVQLGGTGIHGKK